MNNKKLILVVIFLIPIVVISFIYETNYFLQEKNKTTPVVKEKTKKIVKLYNKGTIENITLEEYIIGVVACEMPATFHMETLKAQAVASRTYALKKMNENNIYDLENSINNQCYNDEKELKQKWKNNYKKYYNKIKEAVMLTKNQYITYNDEIIIAFYFAMSNGYTEDSQLVFSETKPYLKSVESQWETNRKDFVETKIFTEEELLQKLKLKNKKINNIKILSRTKTNRVEKLKVNTKIFKGTKFRMLLNLRSTDFDISKNKNNIKIKTKGYGHGVGMSQYGADGLADEGKNYVDILKYYYKDIEIKMYK